MSAASTFGRSFCQAIDKAIMRSRRGEGEQGCRGAGAISLSPFPPFSPSPFPPFSPSQFVIRNS